MRLVGYSYCNGQPPLPEVGYVPLDDLTAFFGANDTGKTRLLRQMRGHLRDLEVVPPASTDVYPFPEAVFFAQCDPLEADFIIGHASSDLPALGPIPDPETMLAGEKWTPPPELRGRDFWRLDGWETERIDRAPVDDEMRCADTMLTALGGALPYTVEHGDALLEALRDSTLLAFEAAFKSVGPWPVLNVYWCLPPLAELGDEVRLALDTLGVRAHSRDPGEPSSTGHSAYGYFQHLTVPYAPVIAAPVGRTNMPVLPSAILVPADLAGVGRDMEDAITRLSTALREADTALSAENSVDAVMSEPPRDAWVEEDDDGVGASLHPDARAACELLGLVATENAPPLLRDRYRLAIGVRPIADWANGRVVLHLADHESNVAFPAAECAEGLRLWTQLPFLEAAALLRQQSVLLTLDLASWRDELMGEADGSFATSGYRDRLSERVESVRGTDVPKLTDVVVPLDLLYRTDPGGVSSELLPLFAFNRGRVYFVDEPEQHLHPRAQRSAVRWLRDTTRAGGSQAVVTTHSVEFLAAGEGTQLVYLRRQPGARAHIEPTWGPEVTALTEQALELGVDRGELMALTRVFLFVEGRNDQTVLEALFSSELHQAGIVVIPIHSVSRASGILQAEALLRFSSAHVAVWFDNVPDAVVARLKNDRDFAGAIRGDKKAPQEVRAMAELVLTGRERGRTVEPLPHPGRDVFDLLDEGVLREVFPDFPGHEEATADLAAAQAARQVSRKDFLLSTYGIADERWVYRAAAEQMRARSLIPDALREVLLRCEQLSLDDLR